jgi:hypothetical protein
VAEEEAAAGRLTSIDSSGRRVTTEDIRAAIGDLRGLTQGGIQGIGGCG